MVSVVTARVGRSSSAAERRATCFSERGIALLVLCGIVHEEKNGTMKKVALITGGSSGIGVSLAHELARRGYRVALAARRAELLEQNVASLRDAGREAVGIRCDVTDVESVRQLVASVRGEWGDIDMAIANAGISIRTKASRFVLEDAEQVMRTNFFGTMYLFDAVIPAMVERRSGRFVGIASLAGLRGLPGAGVYSASKAAMQVFLEASRIELAHKGVGVTIVNPGFIETPMTEKNEFPMPFLMSADKAARIIAKGLDRGARQIEFPLPMSLMVRVARLFPGAAYDLVFGRFGRARTK